MNKIESKGIGLLIKPPQNSNGNLASLKTSPRTNFKPRILEKTKDK